jgi:hypothetical protein
MAFKCGTHRVIFRHIDRRRRAPDNRAMTTLVLQSHRDRPPPAVASACQRVRTWAKQNGHSYRFLDDALFDLVPPDVVAAAGTRRQMAADIARLAWIAKELDDGAERVMWLDADVFIFAPDRFDLSAPGGYAFGHETWVQPDGAGGIKAVRNVHNAVLVFTSAGRTTLDFYRDTATRMLLCAGSQVPPQFVGPKLLSALHNVVQFPLTEAVGMASPLVLRDLAAGGGPALDLLQSKQPTAAAFNLCASLFGTTSDGVGLSSDLIARAVANLSAGAMNTH